MKTDNFNHAEKVLVLGAGQLGAAVLDALVPAVIERQGTVSVIVSPAAWDEAGQLRSANHQALADAGATFLAGTAIKTHRSAAAVLLQPAFHRHRARKRCGA